MLLGRPLQYFWHDDASFVREDSIFIQRQPIPITDQTRLALVLKAINIHLLGQLLYSEQNGEHDPYRRAIIQVFEGHRTSKLVEEEYPGLGFYLDLLKVITHHARSAETFLEALAIGVYCYINFNDTEGLAFLENSEDVCQLLSEVTNQSISSYADSWELADRLVTLIEDQIPDWEREQDYVLTSLPTFAEDGEVLDEMDVEGHFQEFLQKEETIQSAEVESFNEARQAGERLEDAIDWGPKAKKTYELIEADKVPDVFHQSYARVAKHISYFKQYLKLIFQAVNLQKEQPRQRRGMVNNKSMTRIAFGDYRIFKRRYDVGVRSLSFSLLIDRSGSMGDQGSDKCEHSRDAAVLFSEVLDNLNIPFEVAFFCSDLTSPFTVQHFFVKRFEEEYAYVKHRLGATPGKANNDDGASIRLAMDRLERRPETLRYLIVISDGNPCGNGRPREFMQETMRLYRGKPIIAIGDPHAKLGRWYHWYVRSSPEELPHKVARVLGNALRWSVQ
jgi:hypothetical protein